MLESIEANSNATEQAEWSTYLQKSLSGAVPLLPNATANAGLPLDRFSIGTALAIAGNDSYAPTIKSLQDSVALQPRNADNSLWYYNNRANLSAYHNLSYADGMYSYPSFAIVSSFENSTDCEDDSKVGAAAALEQVKLIYDVCKRSDGLVVHGYDASKAHSWADPESGASPLVWGRALGWFTIGVLRSLSLLSQESRAFGGLKEIFNEVVRAQIDASERSVNVTGSYGVWQVVDQPGEKGNFIEASASAMTVYALLKGARTDLIEDQAFREKAVNTGLGIYQTLISDFFIENGNGTLSYNGTSSVASLSGDVNFEVSQVSRRRHTFADKPTVLHHSPNSFEQSDRDICIHPCSAGSRESMLDLTLHTTLEGRARSETTSRWQSGREQSAVAYGIITTKREPISTRKHGALSLTQQVL